MNDATVQELVEKYMETDSLRKAVEASLRSVVGVTGGWFGVYNGKVSISSATGQPPEGANPTLSGTTGKSLKLSWTWNPCDTLTVTVTTEHPASEAYRILSEYASRAEEADIPRPMGAAA